MRPGGYIMPGLEEKIIQTLSSQGRTLATAESCSGGLIGHRLTNVAGSSACYVGGVIVYSNGLKTALLGVHPETLEAHGAVSEAVAQEMAEGARERLGAGVAVAVTGIAGPGGGTPEKPVGLVYLAAAHDGGVTVLRRVFSGGRLEVKEQTAQTALELIWETIA